MEKVWIYQSNRPFTSEEEKNIALELSDFTSGWKAHGEPLAATFEIKYNHFIILHVNEKGTLASGCSLDESVRFMKHLEKKYNLDLFDRSKVACMDDEKLMLVDISHLSRFKKENQITDNTIVFNNTITIKKDFEKDWKLPLKDSLFKKFVI